MNKNFRGMGLKKKFRVSSCQRQHMGMNISNYLSASGKKFWNMVEEVEEEEIFAKLRKSPWVNKLIWINPLKTYIPYAGLQLINIPMNRIKKLFDEKKIFRRLENLGRARFHYYFVEEKGTLSEIADILAMSENHVKKARYRINQFFQSNQVWAERRNDFLLAIEQQDKELIARIDKINNRLKITFSYNDERYRIDRKKIRRIIEKKILKKDEVNEYQKMLIPMEAINFRFKFLNQLVEEVIDHQESFFLDHQKNGLAVLELKKLSQKLQVDPSWTTRVIKNKQILYQGRIINFRDLFISKREFNKKRGKRLLRKILEEHEKKLNKGLVNRNYSDEEIRIKLLSEYNFEIARRTINNWRREIERNLKSGEKQQLDTSGQG